MSSPGTTYQGRPAAAPSGDLPDAGGRLRRRPQCSAQRVGRKLPPDGAWKQATARFGGRMGVAPRRGRPGESSSAARTSDSRAFCRRLAGPGELHAAPARRQARERRADRGVRGLDGQCGARWQDRGRHRRSGDERRQSARTERQARPRLGRARIQPQRCASVLAHHRLGDLGAVVPRLGSLFGPGASRGPFAHAVAFHGQDDSEAIIVGGGLPRDTAHDALKMRLRVADPRRPPSGDEGPSGRRGQAIGPLAGIERANIVNRVTAAGNGIQLEQPATVRTVKKRRDAIAHAVAAF